MTDTFALVAFKATALRVYTALLDVDYHSFGDRFNMLRMQILTQRARLQAVTSLLDTIQHPFDPHIEELVKPCIKDISSEFYTLEKFGDMDQLKESLTNITHLVDSLEVYIPRPAHDVSGMDARSRAKGENWEQKAPTTKPPSDHGLPKEGEVESQKEDQLFRTLVSVCEQSLRSISSSSENLREIFLSYLLWTHNLQSGNIFALFTKPPSELSERRGPNLLKIQYEILAQLAWALSQMNGPDTSTELDKVLEQVHDAGIHVDYFCPPDLEGMHEEADDPQEFVIKKLESLVNLLSSHTFSLLVKVREQPVPGVRVADSHALELEKEQPSCTGELLEVSIQLAEGTSNAINEMSDEKILGKTPVEKSLRDLYNKEVAGLRKWIEENGPKISGKPTTRNESVWEALGLTVFNMIDLLNSISSLTKSTMTTGKTLNSKAGELLAEYAKMNPQLKLSVELSRDQDISAVIRHFGECVQSLVKMEAPLGLIEPPPVYEEKVENKIVSNIED